MRKEVVEHFLSLSVAIRVLTCEVLSTKLEFVKFGHDMRLLFVSMSVEIYGPHFLVYNVHSLVHLSQQVEEFGKLDNTSAFIFENYMQKLKRHVRSARSPVIQVVNRLAEERLLNSHALSLPNSAHTAELQTLCSKPSDNCCIPVEDKRCCQIVEIGKKRVKCMVFNISEPVCASPCDSRVTGIHKVQLASGVMKYLKRTALARKAICHAHLTHSHLAFIALLHCV